MYCKNRNFIGVSNLIRLDPNCGVAVLSSGDYYYCTFCSLGPVHVLLADPRSKKLCKKSVKIRNDSTSVKIFTVSPNQNVNRITSQQLSNLHD